MRLRRLAWWALLLAAGLLDTLAQVAYGDESVVWNQAGESTPDDEGLAPIRVHSAPYDDIGRSLAAEARRLQLTLPPIKVVVSNAAFVPDTWVVKELEMFFGHCSENRKITPNMATVYDSGVRTEDAESIGALAFDESLITNYTAQCTQVTGGCPAYDAYVGLDITSTEDWNEARNPNNTFDLVRVKCVRLFQSEDPRYKADAIAIQEVSLGGINMDRRTVQIFNDAAGGVWTRRPSGRETMWRVQNIWPTRDRWGITELRFFEDVLCSREVRGAAISSGAYNPLSTGEGQAFDGAPSQAATFWFSAHV